MLRDDRGSKRCQKREKETEQGAHPPKEFEEVEAAEVDKEECEVLGVGKSDETKGGRSDYKIQRQS
jgi:hypothetical protein